MTPQEKKNIEPMAFQNRNLLQVRKLGAELAVNTPVSTWASQLTSAFLGVLKAVKK